MTKTEKIIKGILRDLEQNGIEIFTIKKGSKKPAKSTISQLVMTKEENGAPAILIESNDAYAAIITKILIATGNYHAYKDSIEKALESRESWQAVVVTTGLQVLEGLLLPYGDLRLGSDGNIPGIGTSKFLVPEPIKELEAAIEKIVGEVYFTDEATICQKCHRIIQTGYSYGEADWIKVKKPYAEPCWYHLACISEKRALQACMYSGVHLLGSKWNQEKIVGLPSQFESSLVEVPKKYEFGLHEHQDDDPHKIIYELNRENVDAWIRVRTSQFHAEFNVLVKPKNLAKATRILELTSTKADYSPSETMKAALRGQLPTVELNEKSAERSICIQSVNYRGQTTDIQYVSKEEFQNGQFVEKLA